MMVGLSGNGLDKVETALLDRRFIGEEAGNE